MASTQRGRDLVIDLGTHTLRLARVAPGTGAGPEADGSPTLLEMPALTLIDRQRHSVVAVGTQAAGIARGTLPAGVEAVRPLREGRIAAFDGAVALVRAALHEAMGGESALRRLGRRPRALFSLPAGANEADQMVMQDVLRYAGLGATTAIPAVLAAAVGAELPVRGSRPRLVCDIGAGRAEIAVVAGGKVQVARCWPLGGDWLDQAIVRSIRRRRGITITLAMAEEARREVGALDEDYDYRGAGAPTLDGPAGPSVDEGQRRMIAKRRSRGPGELMAQVSAGGSFSGGRRNPHNRSGLPEFHAQDVTAGLGEGVRALIEQIVWFWEDLDPAMRGVVEQDGVTLTGGTAPLPGLGPAIARALHAATTLAADPGHTTLRGLVELGNDRAIWGTPWPWPPEWETGL